MTICMRFSWIVVVVFLTLAFTASFAIAQGVDIPDPNLRARVEAFLGKNDGDAITIADMQTLTLFSAVNADISDLRGLEHATNLLWLDLSDNAISDISPLLALPQLGGVYLDNNPLSMESVDAHIPVLLGRGVDVSYTLPSDVNSDGIVNIQDLVSVTQHFGGAGDLTADVNRDGIVSIKDLTQVAGDMGETTVNDDASDVMNTAEPALSGMPSLDEAFIFEKCIELPGRGFQLPGRGDIGHRPANYRVLGVFIPDPIMTATIQQINRLSAEYKLTEEDLMRLLRNLRRAKILVDDPVYHVVYMPDENLRKVVVALINELGISLGPINRPKELSDPIYAGEMWEIKDIRAEAAGIENLTGLEYATSLKLLLLGNSSAWNWEERIGPGTPNNISDIRPLERLTNLTTLDLNFNNISDIRPLEYLTNLTNLILDRNAIESLFPLRNLRNLRTLGVGENKITDIAPLADLTNLKHLGLNNESFRGRDSNRISDLTPLRKLTNLEGLVTSNNPIGSSIDIVRNFPKLKLLIISCCGVSSLWPLLESPGLRAGSHVQVIANPLEEEDIPDIKALEDRGVTVSGPTYWKDEKGIVRDFDNHLDLCR